ncbi:hypothetical protein Dimus_003721 [Dionaea muscipula]
MAEEKMMEIEAAKRRCEAVAERISSLPRSKITEPCKRTLLRLVTSELNFLSRLSLSISRPSSSLSCNIGYIEAIVDIIHQPCITGVSRVCKPVSSSQAANKGWQKVNQCKYIHVDIVCMFHKTPVWFIVSDRNPKYITWDGSGGDKSLKLRVQRLLAEAGASPALQPSSVIFFFSNGLDDFVRRKLITEVNCSEYHFDLPHFEFTFSEELDGEWVNVVARSYQKACILSLKVKQYPETCSKKCIDVKESAFCAVEKVTEKQENQSRLGFSFHSLISDLIDFPVDIKQMESSTTGAWLGKDCLINFDTTALIAIISGISNGGSEKILAVPESELKKRFKSNSNFLISQAQSETERPIHSELHDIICGKSSIICETVYSEFMGVVSMCGGPNERSRADVLIKRLRIVADTPSARMMSLPTTRKLASKNKVIFGTGDYWGAPTLTANMGYVRAISQTGMSLLTIEHRPRALIGE